MVHWIVDHSSMKAFYHHLTEKGVKNILNSLNTDLVIQCLQKSIVYSRHRDGSMLQMQQISRDHDDIGAIGIMLLQVPWTAIPERVAAAWLQGIMSHPWFSPIILDANHETGNVIQMLVFAI